MARGNITRRGKSSWRIKFDIGRDTVTGKRRFHLATVHGTHKDAEKELTRLLSQSDGGALVDAHKISLGDYLTSWVDQRRDTLSPGSVERYADIISRLINPRLGKIELQRLKPLHIRDWLSSTREKGGRNGQQLSARSCADAYRVLHKALKDAVKLELLSRNVAEAVTPPKTEAEEVEILDSNQIAAVLEALKGHHLYSIVVLAISTGMRRGELLALPWRDIDGDVLTVERSLEQTSAGLRFKGPKSRHGRRPISLPVSAVAFLSEHRKKQLELRMALGMGKPDADALVFCQHDGNPISPNAHSKTWRRTIADIPGVPQVRFHALRHSHASALIAAGIDVVTVSRRLGHGSASFTLNVYSHLFGATDKGAADAIGKVLG